MFTFEISILLMLCAIAAGVIVIQALHMAFSRTADIRRALDQCPGHREIRFTLREVTVRYDDGKVVPLRRRGVISLPARTAGRAAA